MNYPHHPIVHSLFGNVFEAELIEDILKTSEYCNHKRNEILLEVGSQVDFIPLMTAGAIKIMREDNEDKEIFLYYVEAGQTCAASLTCCLNNHRSNILAIVEEDASFMAIPVGVMDEWMVKYKSWRHFILNNYSSRYEELLFVVDLLAFKKMDDRISNYLKDKAAVHNTEIIQSSHQEIAYDLNTSREVVSRILKQMEVAGKIELKRGKIILKPSKTN